MRRSPTLWRREFFPCPGDHQDDCFSLLDILAAHQFTDPYAVERSDESNIAMSIRRRHAVVVSIEPHQCQCVHLSVLNASRLETSPCRTGDALPATASPCAVEFSIVNRTERSEESVNASPVRLRTHEVAAGEFHQPLCVALFRSVP